MVTPVLTAVELMSRPFVRELRDAARDARRSLRGPAVRKALRNLSDAADALDAQLARGLLDQNAPPGTGDVPATGEGVLPRHGEVKVVSADLVVLTVEQADEICATLKWVNTVANFDHLEDGVRRDLRKRLREGKRALLDGVWDAEGVPPAVHGQEETFPAQDDLSRASTDA